MYNYKTINIESEEFINWKNVVNFGEIQSLHDAESTEYAYFGNNRGYWQVYFKYLGNDYKINKNNANFNLEKSDQEEPAVIEILHHNNGIFADFRAHSGHDYFWMKIGKPVERGILVSVTNELSADVSEVRLVYAESTATRHVNTETDENIQFKEEVSFDDQTVGSNQTITGHHRS